MDEIFITQLPSDKNHLWVVLRGRGGIKLNLKQGREFAKALIVCGLGLNSNTSITEQTEILQCALGMRNLRAVRTVGKQQVWVLISGNSGVKISDLNALELARKIVKVTSQENTDHKKEWERVVDTVKK